MTIGVFNGNFRAGDYRRYRQQIEADARDPKQALLRIEKRLMQECYQLEGESFIEWYDSPSVPDNGFIQERIDMIRARIAEIQSQPSPIDEAQEIERGIDRQLFASGAEMDADWESHCKEVADTRATDYPM